MMSNKHISDFLLNLKSKDVQSINVAAQRTKHK